MTRDETRFLLGRLCSAYGRRAPTTDTVDEWHRGLETLRSSPVHAALDSLIQEGNPGPNLATIIARAKALDDTRRVAYVPDRWDGPTQNGRNAIAKIKAQLAELRTDD